jgi:DNA-binding beta-propeller fold protein YncE
MKYFVLFILFACLTSCVKDKPNPDSKLFPSNTNNGIVILNEGAFGNNNAEISFLDLDKKEISNNLFRLANNKSLGDVAQSITYHDGKYYVVVNNSNKIVIIDALAFNEISTISSIISPRYIQITKTNKAYVSSFLKTSIYVIDLNTNTIVNTIPIDFQGSEHLLLQDSILWITNWNVNSNLIYKLNTNTDVMMNKISLPGFASHSLAIDATKKLWVLSGNRYKNRNSFLTRINTVNSEIEKSFSFTNNEEPIRLLINGDCLYYINVNYDGLLTNNGIYKMKITDSNLPTTAYISAPLNSYFWSFGIDVNSDHIFVSDPKGFTQQSAILEYDEMGVLLNTYKAGLGANSFLFKK